MRLNFRKTALHATTALMATYAMAPSAAAHTDSLGFIITQGSGTGLFDVDIFYGSWHTTTGAPEGALDLTNTTTNTLVGTNAFQLYPGFDGVADGTLPPGLTPGVNYFFPDGLGGLTGDPSGHSIYSFQYVTFTDLVAGSYQFGYNTGSSLSVNWEPSDPMINAGTFVIAPNGDIIIIGAGPLTIDTSQETFSVDDFAADTDLTFDGGTLLVAEDSPPVTNDVIVNAPGGYIDTNMTDVTFEGDFSGDGVITVVGHGTANLTGVNTNAGFYVNHAAISAGDDAALGAEGAALTLYHGTFTPTQSMSIERDVVVSSNHGGAFNVAEDLTLTLNGEVSGTGCLYKQGLGVLDLRANASNAIGACVEEGLMAFNSVFTGNVWVDAGAFISGGGTIVGDVEVSGTLSPGNSPGQLIVAGSVTQLPGSTLQVDIDGLTVGNGAGHYDTLVLTGGSSIYTADGTLAPILRGITAPANNTFTPDVGDTFLIVTAEGGVAGTFDALTQPGSGLAAGTRFDVIYGDNTIALAVTMADYSLLTGGLRNARSAGAALQGVRPDAGTGTGDVGAFFDSLAGLNEAQLAAAFQQVAGDIHATGREGAHRNSRVGRAAVRSRLSEAEPSRHLWGEIVGADADIDGDDTANGFDYRSGGLVVGLDAPVGNGWNVGGAFAYVDGVARGDGRPEVESYQALAYARWTDGSLFSNSSIGYSVDRYDIRRGVGLSTGVEELTSTPDGETIAVEFEFGRTLQALGGQVDVLGGVSWEEVSRNSVTETGAATVALSFADTEDDATRLRLGARYGRDLQSSGITIRPYAQAYLVHATESGGADANATLHGATFTTASADPGQTGLETGLGFVATLSESLELYAHYRGDFTENQTEHGARLGARLAW